MFHYGLPPNGLLLITLLDLNSVTETTVPSASALNRWSILCPLNNRSIIAIPRGLRNCRLCVYDALGRNVFEYNDITVRTIRMPNLSAGVYFAKLETDTETKIQKIIVIQ
jgi:hypothetical protein